jgi:hypothetical protein
MDLVATAPCTDPIQVNGLVNADDFVSHLYFLSFEFRNDRNRLRQ